MSTRPTSAPRDLADGIPVHCAFDELADIESLVPNPRNPNTHPDSQVALLAKIIKAQGWRAPITVSNRSGFIVRGHCRLLAAQLLGVKQVPVDRQDYATDEEELADLIADNRIAELAEMDSASLQDLLREIETAGLDLEIAGFTETDMEALAAQASGLDASPASEEGSPSSSEEAGAGEATVRCPWCGHEFAP